MSILWKVTSDNNPLLYWLLLGQVGLFWRKSWYLLFLLNQHLLLVNQYLLPVSQYLLQVNQHLLSVNQHLLPVNQQVAP